MYTRMIANEFLLLVQELFRLFPQNGVRVPSSSWRSEVSPKSSGREWKPIKKKKKKKNCDGDRQTRTMNINSATGWLLPTELNLVIIIPSLKKNKLYNNMPTQWHHISTVIIFSGCASIMRRSLRFTTDSTQTDTNWPGSTG